MGLFKCIFQMYLYIYIYFCDPIMYHVITSYSQFKIVNQLENFISLGLCVAKRFSINAKNKTLSSVTIIIFI